MLKRSRSSFFILLSFLFRFLFLLLLVCLHPLKHLGLGFFPRFLIFLAVFLLSVFLALLLGILFALLTSFPPFLLVLQATFVFYWFWIEDSSWYMWFAMRLFKYIRHS